jgi:transcriptional regulator with XRE-family HTH domain
MAESTFGGRLRELREKAGLTQQQLASQIAMSLSGLAALEQGKRDNPNWDTIMKLADALDCSTEAFRDAPTSEHNAQRGRPKKVAAPSEEKPTEKRGRPRKASGE